MKSCHQESFSLLDTSRSAGLLLAGVLAIALIPSTAIAELTADYQFHGNFASSVGTVPTLTVPGEGSWSFSQDNVDGVTADVLELEEDSGLKLEPITGILSPGTYSIAILVRIDSPRIDEEDEYTRIIEFKALEEDDGLYIFENDLIFYDDTCDNDGPELGADNDSYSVSTWHQIVFTRDGASDQIVFYLDGVQQFAYTDDCDRAVFDAGSIHLLIDEGSSEDPEGAVARVRFYDTVLTPSEVAALDGAVPGVLPPPPPERVLTFTRFVGTEGGPGADDGTGSEARFYGPEGVATDNLGNVYVADTDNSTIRKISPAGVVTTLAGVAEERGGADGKSSEARFLTPLGLATDGRGNLYVSDYNHATIRKVTPTGIVTTFAGLADSDGSSDGTGSEARFRFPAGLTSDSSGNVYVADSGNHTIRKITPTGVVTTLAGTAGESGSTDGTGSAARFDEPTGIAADSAGNLYVCEYANHTVRMITPEGVVTTLAGLAGEAAPDDGVGSAARFSYPEGVALDSDGNVYVSDGGSMIRKITPAGVVTTLAGDPYEYGGSDGTGSEARFSSPAGLATDGDDNILVAERDNDQIRKVSPAGVVTTLAGLYSEIGSADGTGSAARFYEPGGMAVDNGGNIYVADNENHTIRKISPAGVVTTFAGLAGEYGSANGTGSAARFNDPSAVATDSNGNIYVADTGNTTIRKITPAGVVTTLAGSAGQSGSVNGTGGVARFNYPAGVATDGTNVYVADTDNHTIRKITPAGVVTTLAGLAGEAGSDDGTGNAARFDSPTALALDSNGNVYVADRRNNTIRKISPAGVVTTLAGLAGEWGDRDGMGSAARFDDPRGLASDSDGNIYVADSDNYAIRKISPTGVVKTLAGLAGEPGNAQGTAEAARFSYPTGVAVDSEGNVFVANTSGGNIVVGLETLDDVATIDVSFGTVGVTRLLSSSPQTATSWQWNVIRAPADSVATLSSTSVASPTFTPDKRGLYVFQLVAKQDGKASVTTVELHATPLRRRGVQRN